MTTEEYIQLYKKYISGKYTSEEERKLFEYKDDFKMQDENDFEGCSREDKPLRRKIHKRIVDTIQPLSKNAVIYSLVFKYAAAMLIIVSAGILFYYINGDLGERKQDNILVSKQHREVKMDSTVINLTLSDGSVISLNKAQNGRLASEGSTQISKMEGGQIVYKTIGEGSHVDISMNKLYVPKGSQFELVLTDGTKVWLNTNSTLSYPSEFRGEKREVELSGEAYFEVAKNDKMPFIVKTKKTKVQVLGTHFDISAYADDNFEKTILMEGSVKVSKDDGHAVILKPGQEGIIGDAEGIRIKQANLQQALAWKAGFFIFDNDQLRDVMKQISRWYDVDIKYQTAAQDKFIGGIYSKSKDLEELLKGLELTGIVKFKMKGRKVIVMD